MIPKRLFYAVLLLCFFSFRNCSKVVDLTSDTFSLLEGTEFTLVKFYTEWCTHCKDLHPKYEAAAEKLAETNLSLFRVDCDKNTELCQKHQVTGYPTLKAFYNGKFAKDYNLARDSDSIVDFVKRGNQPAYTVINSEEALATQLANKKEPSVLAIVPESHENKSAIIDRFASVAREISHLNTFFITHLTESEHLKDYPNATFLITAPKVIALDLDFLSEDIVPHIHRSKLPLYGKLDETTYETYSSAKLPIAFLFATPEEGPTFEKTMTEVAEKFLNIISIAWIDSSLYGSHSQTLGLSSEKFPCLAVHDMEKGLKFPYDESKPLDSQSIIEFLGDIQKGSISPYFKSEPIPDEIDVVKKLVYNNLQSILNSPVAVLIKFYAPWCQACKRLAPNYSNVTEAFKSQSDKIQFAEFDLENNDLPLEIEESIRMIPALYLYLPQTKTYSDFIKFQGEPYKANIAEFLLSNCEGLKPVEISADDHVPEEPYGEDADSGFGSELGDEHGEDEISHEDL